MWNKKKQLKTCLFKQMTSAEFFMNCAYKETKHQTKISFNLFLYDAFYNILLEYPFLYLTQESRNVHIKYIFDFFKIRICTDIYSKRS